MAFLFSSDDAPGTQYEHSEELILASLSVILKVAAGMRLPGTAKAINLISKAVVLGVQEELIDSMERFVAEKHVDMREQVKHRLNDGLLASWTPKKNTPLQ